MGDKIKSVYTDKKKSVVVTTYVIERPEAPEAHSNVPLKDPSDYNKWADRTLPLDPEPEPEPVRPATKTTGKKPPAPGKK